MATTEEIITECEVCGADATRTHFKTGQSPKKLCKDCSDKSFSDWVGRDQDKRERYVKCWELW